MNIYNLDSFKSGKKVDSYAKNAVMIFSNKGKNAWEGKVEFACCKSSDTVFIKLKPNDQIPLHKHSSCEEINYIVEGTGFVNNKNKRIKIKKGDVLFISENEPHNYIASKKGLSILVFHSPPMKDRQFVK